MVPAKGRSALLRLHTPGGRKGRDAPSGGKRGAAGKTRGRKGPEIPGEGEHGNSPRSRREAPGWGTSSWCLPVGEGRPLHDAQHQATVSPNPLFRLTPSRGAQRGVSHQGFDHRGNKGQIPKVHIFLISLAGYSLSANTCDHRTPLCCLIMGSVQISTKSNDKSTETLDWVLSIMELGGRRYSELDTNVF